MIKNLNQTENKKKLFSPVNGSYFKMFLTFIYFVLLSIAIKYLINLDIYDLPQGIISEIIIGPLYFLLFESIIFLIISSLVITIIIHKSFIKGLFILIVELIAFSTITVYTSTESNVVWVILSVLFNSPILLEISVFSFLARAFFKLRKWFQIVILIIPFIIIAIFNIVVVIKGL